MFHGFNVDFFFQYCEVMIRNVIFSMAKLPQPFPFRREDDNWFAVVILLFKRLIRLKIPPVSQHGSLPLSIDDCLGSKGGKRGGPSLKRADR